MERKTIRPTSLWKLTFALALLLLAPAARQLQATSTISCPQGCGYTWNPATRCCEPDPRFDCVEFCF